MNVIDKVHVYKCLHFASIKSIAGNKTNLFPSPFLISTSRFCNLAEAFQNDYVAACGTVFRSSTVKNEMGGCVSVPCSTKMRERSSTPDWINF